MELILKQSVENLGEANDLVKVKNGYGRNYLIPKGLAIVANESNKKILSENLKQQEHKAAEVYKSAKDAADKIQKATITVGAKVGKDDKIFGSVTNIQLADAINKITGIKVDRKKVNILDDIKKTGTYNASVELHRELTIETKFEVISE
jgi:large subunit ribosomal protein L9|tara:strand:+ start:613 stop:1059 length:447 start_codon:yes stop_codon:yes gene_type:complete